MRSPEQFRPREEPRFRESRVENISHEILESQEIMDYLMAKIQQKMDFKESISRDDGTNDFSSWKRLGMFIAHEDRLPRELISILQRNSVDIYDDEVLELHIPPQNASIADARKSFDRLREYLKARRENGRIPRYIFGVSYLARLAKHWGFTVVDLPDDIQKSSGATRVLPSFLERYSDATEEKKKRIARKYTTKDIKFCFISVDDLLSGENPAMFGGGRPEAFVLKAAEIIPTNGKVIELGAGEGRNAIALAEKGLQVTAIDISQVGVDLMNEKAKELGLANFHAEVGDSREVIDGEIDMVVSTFMLHHLSKEDAERLIEKIKEHTKKGGVNAVVTFTAEGDFAKLPKSEGRFYPASGYMKELYKDWEIISYKEEPSKAKQTRPDGGSMFNIKAEIIARKPI